MRINNYTILSNSGRNSKVCPMSIKKKKSWNAFGKNTKIDEYDCPQHGIHVFKGKQL